MLMSEEALYIFRNVTHIATLRVRPCYDVTT